MILSYPGYPARRLWYGVVRGTPQESQSRNARRTIKRLLCNGVSLPVHQACKGQSWTVKLLIEPNTEMRRKTMSEAKISLEDRQEIYDTLARYVWSMDTGDIAGVVATFT